MITRSRFAVRSIVNLRSPLDSEPKGPWRIESANTGRVPVEYTLTYTEGGAVVARIIADERELELAGH